MKLSRIAMSGMLAVAATIGVSGASSASAAEYQPHFEEHTFTGSSTSAAAFQEWFAGEEFVRPTIETRDLTELKVNEFQTAQAGDVIYKDDSGEFWIQEPATT